MNGENYIQWLKGKLLPNLDPNSVLVIHNAPYHNIQKGKAPTSNSSKETMKKWLRVRNILFCDTMLLVTECCTKCPQALRPFSDLLCIPI
jgi:hypothetical protein